VIDQAERLYIEMVLKETRGRVGQAAKIAGIHTRALYNKMKRLELKKEKFRTKDHPAI
jgi:DNA-binding NtrC family response regulator